MRLTLLIVLLLANSFVQAQLPAPVQQALQADDIPSDAVSVWAQRLDDGKLVLAHQANMPRNPASVIKLLTSYAALDLLGPSFRWSTQVYAYPTLNTGQNKLNGSLIIKGSGDPSLSYAELNEMASEIKQKWALQEICCELLLDNSAYEKRAFNAAAFDNKPYRAYNAPAEALMVNLQSLRLAFSVQGKSIQTAMFPDLPSINKKIDVKLSQNLLGQENCGEWKDKLTILRQADSLQVQGSYAADCGDKYIDIYWQDGLDLFAKAWQSAWLNQAGKAQWQSVKSGLTPANAQLLLEHVSKPLSDIVHDMNKTSNNVAARALYLALARFADSTQAASEALAERAMRAWIKSKGWEFSELVLENGAGLSRNERISAEHLGTLLSHAYQSPVMPELMSSLPVYGMDGTLKNRKDVALYGKAHLKTGSLEGVRAVAGYLLDQKGRRYAVVWIVNGDKAHRAKAAQDAMLNWLYWQN